MRVAQPGQALESAARSSAGLAIALLLLLAGGCSGTGAPREFASPAAAAVSVDLTMLDSSASVTGGNGRLWLRLMPSGGQVALERQLDWIIPSREVSESSPRPVQVRFCADRGGLPPSLALFADLEPGAYRLSSFLVSARLERAGAEPVLISLAGELSNLCPASLAAGEFDDLGSLRLMLASGGHYEYRLERAEPRRLAPVQRGRRELQELRLVDRPMAEAEPHRANPPSSPARAGPSGDPARAGVRDREPRGGEPSADASGAPRVVLCVPIPERPRRAVAGDRSQESDPDGLGRPPHEEGNGDSDVARSGAREGAEGTSAARDRSGSPPSPAASPRRGSGSEGRPAAPATGGAIRNPGATASEQPAESHAPTTGPPTRSPPDNALLSEPTERSWPSGLPSAAVIGIVAMPGSLLRGASAGSGILRLEVCRVGHGVERSVVEVGWELEAASDGAVTAPERARARAQGAPHQPEATSTATTPTASTRHALRLACARGSPLGSGIAVPLPLFPGEHELTRLELRGSLRAGGLEKSIAAVADVSRYPPFRIGRGELVDLGTLVVELLAPDRLGVRVDRNGAGERARLMTEGSALPRGLAIVPRPIEGGR